MRVVVNLSSVLAIAVATGAYAAESNCDQYSRLDQLPDRFKEIGRGEIGGTPIEIVVATDRTCSCNNVPKINRALGKPAEQGVNWSCRQAAPDDWGDN
jgi:hypothetical protein